MTAPLPESGATLDQLLELAREARRHPYSHKRRQWRDKAIVSLVARGYTPADVAATAGLSPTRIHEICLRERPDWRS